MVCQLLCTDENKAKLEGLLLKYNVVIDDSADLLVVEKKMVNQVGNRCVVIAVDADRIEEAELVIAQIFSGITQAQDFTGNHLIGKYDDKYSMVQFEDISYFSANSNDVYFHSDRSYHCKYKLYELENGLMNKGFIRINKSEIVNIKKVSEIVPWFNSRYVLTLSNEQELVVTKSYTKAFKSYIGL